MASLESKIAVTAVALRQTAFSIEQMAPGGIDRANPGQISELDLNQGIKRLIQVRTGLGKEQRRQLNALNAMLHRTQQLQKHLHTHKAAKLVYIDDELFALEPRLRSTAIEIDFNFGDRDGTISSSDLRQARDHYELVRGPVGWNRLIATDEVERHLYPLRALSSSEGTKLLPTEWLAAPPNRLQRLTRISRYLSDTGLARSYADIAARFACSPKESPFHITYEGALKLLGSEIRKRGSIKPTLTDIARIGCEDPEIKAVLRSPIEMSRRLHPAALLNRFLD
ncbi:MAG: hypothetical protein KTR25_06020 [Myxococcales bacterium]|nr:hypothetical protein [Myxococcales bacterium]